MLMWLDNWIRATKSKNCRLSAEQITEMLPFKFSLPDVRRKLKSLAEKKLITITSRDGQTNQIQVLFDEIEGDQSDQGNAGEGDQSDQGNAGEGDQSDQGTMINLIREGDQSDQGHYIKKSEKEEGERSPPGSLQNTRLAGGYGASADPGARADPKPVSRPRQPDPKPKKPKHKDWLDPEPESRPLPATKPNRRPTSKDWLDPELESRHKPVDPKVEKAWRDFKLGDL